MTYSPPKLNSNREVFDYVKNHLLTQNTKAEFKHEPGRTTCLYRTNEGLMCAAGCLIADEHYGEHLESRPANNEAVYNAIIKSIGGFKPNEWLLRELQTVHDCCPVDEWNNRLVEVETNYV